MKLKKMGLLLMTAAMMMGTTLSPVTTMADDVLWAVNDQISPLIDNDGADPFVTTYGDQYLYTKTTGGNVCIGLADSIQTLGAAELKPIFEPGSSLRDLWAPEIWRLDDCWYVYFAAVIPGNEMHFMFVLKNESENPMEGEWTCEQLAGMDDKFAIDGTIMELNGKRYFLWSGWEGYENVRQDIYMAEMVSPTEVMEEKILLSMPEFGWEKNGNPLINEGPEVVVRDNTVNLVYSASGSWTDYYCLGLLTMDASADPKNPDNWTKHEEPILSKKEDVFGPGHNCFTVSKDGSEDLNIYHAARWKDAGWTRNIRFGYVDFDENGMMLPMEVTSGENTIKIPSGETEVTVFSADLFEVSENVEIKGEEGARYAYGFSDTADYAKCVIYSEEEQDVTLTVFVKAKGYKTGTISGLNLTINGETMSKNLFSSVNAQPLYYRVHLNQGDNEVEIHTNRARNTLSISSIEIRK